MAGVVTDLGPWAWIVLGLVLAGLELLAPGVFLIWFGLAALLTGALDWAVGLSWQAAGLTFAGLALVSVLVGRKLAGARDDVAAPRDLSRRGQALVGQVFTVEEGLSRGEGRIRVGDSSWRVVGADAPAGAWVRVVRVDGATLVVEPANPVP